MRYGHFKACRDSAYGRNENILIDAGHRAGVTPIEAHHLYERPAGGLNNARRECAISKLSFELKASFP